MKLRHILVSFVLLAAYNTLIRAQDTSQQSIDTENLATATDELARQKEDHEHLGKAIGKLHAIIKMHRQRATHEIKEKIGAFFKEHPGINKFNIVAALLPLAILMKAPLAVDVHHLL